MTVPRRPEMQALADALAAPFEPREVKFKPQMVKNNRCLAMAYIDARLIQDRLDEVLGVENWSDVYRILADGSVMCRLRCKLGDRWITKTDVGSPSEQPDGGDRLKAAFSDALKRAAVKFGIGRYLYRLSAQWVEYDPVKKQIVQPPQLPAFAIPKPKHPGAPAGPKSPDPAPAVPLGTQLLELIDKAPNLAALQGAFGSAFKAHEARQISDDEYRRCEGRKDERKVWFAALDDGRKRLAACPDMGALGAYWQSLDGKLELQKALRAHKETRKAELQATQQKAATK